MEFSLGTPALLCDLAPTHRDEYLGISRETVSGDSTESGSQFIGTTDCDYCGKPFREGDQYTVDANGKLIRCLHWPSSLGVSR